MEGFRTILFTHMIAFAAGILLDLLIGDPHWMPHPIRLIGRLIGALEGRLLGPRETPKTGAAPQTRMTVRDGRMERRKGVILVLLVLVLTVAVTAAVVIGAYAIHIAAGVIVEAILTAYALAARSLTKESGRVQKELENGDFGGARRAVSMIVGRDTEQLDAAGVTRAAVETVAENASDGVVAPMLYLALGGPVLGFFYKAVNTMDSMVGYRNERYRHFGTAAARLDDVLNFGPARIAALLMIAASAIGGPSYDAASALRIWRRDRRKHKSPNAAQTESVCAGALGVELAGDAVYFGQVVPKETIGDPIRLIEPADIRRTNGLMLLAALLLAAVCLAVMAMVLHVAR